MIVRAEAPQLHLLAVLDLLRVAVAPFDGHFRVSIGVDEDVEGAVPVENREEGHGRRDLSEDRLDLFLDLFLCLLLRWRCGVDVSGIASPSAMQEPRLDFAFGGHTLDRHSLYPPPSAKLGSEMIFPKFGPIYIQADGLARSPRPLYCRVNLTLNSHLSTCSPVSLLVMTTTSLDIFPPIIHLFSCDMIFLM